MLSVTDDSEKYLYLHRDYLGSITLITDNAGNALERRHFDAWGNITNYWNAEGKTTIPEEGILLDRGYTGHEHLLSVGLIHMNGRLYDPVLHRFLQPDNYVQDPFNTQNFNRYGYCLNNPLVYVDENGEFWHLVIAAVVGGVINLTMNAIQGNVKSFGEGLAYFGTGALSGLASSVNPLLGGAVLGLGNNITTQVSYNGWSNINWTSAIIDTGIGMGSAYIGSKFSGISSRIFKDISSPILRNVLISGTSNVASGFVVSGGASYIMNGDVDQALKDGAKGAGYGLALGSALGVVQGFQYAREYDVNPWTGKRNDFFKGTWYSDRVLGNMFNTSDAFHSFPENVKAFQMDGVVTPLKGKDGVIVPILKIPGSYRGKEGYFEFIKERDGMINHRFFRPNSK